MKEGRAEIWQVADALSRDLAAASAKLVELRSQLSALELEDGRPRCPYCGYRSSMNLPSVAEHLEVSHPELLTV